VLLHTFVKKTQKTPAREIEKAKRELEDLKERGLSHEE
jgi:phage-related protein